MTTILSALSDNTPTGVLVIQPSDNPPSLEGVSPLQNNQVIGNDGAGRIAPVTLVAGSGMTITQTDDQIELASTGGGGGGNTAISWVGTPYNYGSGIHKTIPLNPAVTSLSDTLAYDGTSQGMTILGSQIFADQTTSTITMLVSFVFATDFSLTNSSYAPSIIWAFYVSNQGSATIPAGQEPFYSSIYALAGASDSVGAYSQYVFAAEMSYPDTAVTRSIIAVPYPYVPSGQTLQGTNTTGGSGNNYGIAYSQESNEYSIVLPQPGAGEDEPILLNQVSMSIVNQKSSFPYGSLSSVGMVLAEADLVAVGAPAAFAFKCCIPIYIVLGSTTATTVTVNVGVYAAGSSINSIFVVYDTVGKTHIMDTINFCTAPTFSTSFDNAQVLVSYITDNAATLSCTATGTVTCLYDSYLKLVGTDIASVAPSDMQKQTRNVPTTVSLPITQTTFPIFNFSLTYAVDTFTLTTNYAESQLDIAFTLCFSTDAYSTNTLFATPCIAVTIGTSNGVSVSQYIATTVQSISNTAAGQTVYGSVLCRGRLNVLSTTTQLVAMAAISNNGTFQNVVVTNLTAYAPGDPSIPSGAGSNWVINIQSPTSGGGSGGGGTTGGITDVVPVTDSYLTAEVVGTVADIGTIQASSSQAGLVAATTAFPANSLVQIEASGAVPCEITSLDGSIVVTTGSGSIDLASAINASTGLTDAYSPVSIDNVLLASDVVLNVEYVQGGATNRSPDISVVQVIATGSVTCQHDGSDGAYVQCNACIGYFTDAASELGAQFCLYASTLGTEPMAQTTFLHQGTCSTNTYDNYSNTTLSFQTPSIKGQEITYSIGARYLAGTTVTVDASAFSMYVEEILPNTKSIVQSVTVGLSNTAKLVQQNYTGSSQKYSTTRALASVPFTKYFSNSSLQVVGYVENLTNGINGEYQGYALFYINTSNNPLYTAFVGTCKGVGAFTEIDTNGIGTATNISYTVPSSQLGAGNYTAALGGTKSSSSLSYYVLGGTLLVNEILPQANGGIISYDEAGLVIFSGSAIPAVTTISPQYSQVLPVQELDVVTRATGGLCYIELPVTQYAQAGAVENQLQICVYTSNSPTATPIKSWRNTCPYSGSTSISNANSVLYRYYFLSPLAGTEYTIYVGAASLTSTVTTAWFSCNATFYEVFTGNVLESGIGSVTTQASSYLTATTTGSDVVLGDIQASTTQAGLVALASATPANSLIQMGSAEPVACTLTSSDNSVTITPSEGSIDLSTAPSTGTGIVWATTATGLAMLPNRGYYLTNTGGVITMTLGTGFVLGSVIEIECSTTCAGVTIQMGAGQTIYSNALVSTDGGSMTLLATGSSMSILCVVADTTFSANATESVTVA